MYDRKVKSVLVAAALLGLAACSDEAGDLPTEAEAPRAVSMGEPGVELNPALYENAAPVSTAEREAIEAIAHSLALALRDPEIRQEVKAALASSTLREQKLHFASFMQGRGGNILAAMQRNGGLDPRSFRRVVAKVRELEFYMPVDAHRDTWTGGPDVLVGAEINEDLEEITAFMVTGERRTLSIGSPPTVPFLSLVPVETDFRQQIALNERGSVASLCTVRIAETLAAASARCSSSAGVPSVPEGVNGLKPSILLAADPNTTGLYVDNFYVYDYEEPFTRGDPELEIHAFAKRSATDGSAKMFQCSGEHANNPSAYQPGIRDQAYVFDNNDKDFTGLVRVLNPAQLDTAQTAEHDGFNIALWEDDDTACNIKQEGGEDYFKKAISATANIVKGAVALFVVPKDAKPNYEVAAGSFGSAAGDLYDLVQGSDDLIGVAVDQDSTAYAGKMYSPSTNHILFRGTDTRGRIQLIYK